MCNLPPRQEGQVVAKKAFCCVAYDVDRVGEAVRYGRYCSPIHRVFRCVAYDVDGVGEAVSFGMLSAVYNTRSYRNRS